MTAFEIQEVLDATGALLLRGDPHRRVNGISTDSRTVARDELFFALSGPNFDGNRFARRAFEQGAGGVVVRAGVPRGAPVPEGWPDVPESAFDIGSMPPDRPVLVHGDPRRALSDLAAWHRARLLAPVIGITGSCGKTTTKSVLVSLLEDTGGVVGSPSSFNNDIGVPLTLFLADGRADYLVVEMGTNRPGEIAALCRTAQPTAGVITNVGAAHLEGLGSVNGVANEKGDLARALPEDGFCVLNADCRFTPLIRSMTSAEVITFSVEGDGDLDATDVYFHAGGTTFRVDGTTLTSPLLGLHNVQNLLAALAACRGLGIPFEEVLPAVARLKGGRRRMERLELGGVTVLDDSYNANPESARASVRVLAGLHGHARRVLVLGEMLELGELAPELHHAVGREAAEAGVDLLVLVGPLCRAAAAGAVEAGLAPDQVVHTDRLDEARKVVLDLVREGDAVLVKGSRRSGLDALVEGLVSARDCVPG